MAELLRHGGNPRGYFICQNTASKDERTTNRIKVIHIKLFMKIIEEENVRLIHNSKSGSTLL